MTQIIAIRFAAAQLVITTGTVLPAASLSTAYSMQLQATGGVLPLTWTLVSGADTTGFPALDPATGILSGTPTIAGSLTLSVQVHDSMGTGASANFTLQINANLAIASTSPLPSATVGATYSYTFSATGGNTPYTWSVLSGLPAWATFTTNGTLTGTPTAAESDVLNVQVKDAQNRTASTTFALSVGTVSDAYPLLAAVTYGTQNYTSGWIGQMQKRHHVFSGAYPGLAFQPTCQSIVTGSTLASPTRIHNYNDHVEVFNDWITNTAQANYPWASYFNTQKWFLYPSPALAGTAVQSGWAGSGYTQINNTTYPAVDGSGKTWYQWLSNWLAGWNFNGVGQAANTYLAGSFCDNVGPAVYATGYWNPAGTSSGAAEPYPNQQARTGTADFLAALRTGSPTNAWVSANMVRCGNATATNTGLSNLVDVALAESHSGQSFSYETSGWSVAVAAIQKLQGLVTGRANGGVVWHADQVNPSTGQDYASGLRGDPNWQGAHYTVGAAMVLGCYYANTQGGNYACAAQFDLDEFDCGGAQSREYLGQPLAGPQGAIQTAAWKTYSGHPVWRRDFANGIVLVRPPENSPVTTANTTSITVPAADLNNTTYYLFTGTQDTARYTGGSVTSWTFPRDRDSVILLRAQNYTFDHYISPTGSDTNDGRTPATAWSSSAIGGTVGTGYTVLGCLPGVYTSNTAAGNFNTWISTNGTTPTGHTIPSGKTIASCDANGHYSPRTAIFDAGSTTPNKYTGHVQPTQDAGFFFAGGSNGWTIDGLEIRNFSSGIVVGYPSVGNNWTIQNCDIHDGMCNAQPNNVSAIGGNDSALAGGNGCLTYNCYMHNFKNGHYLNCTVTSISNTGCTLTTLNGLTDVVTDGWPFKTGAVFSINFPDINKTIINCTGTHGSTAIAFPSGTSFTTLPSGSARIQTQNSSSVPSGSVLPLYMPWGMWGWYSEGLGITTPIVVESCTFVKAAWWGDKTTPCQLQWNRVYAESVNFNYYNDPPGMNGTSYAAQGFSNPLATHHSSLDHCIIVGYVQAYGQGAVGDMRNNSWPSPSNMLVGTFTENHCTLYSPTSPPPGATSTNTNIWGTQTIIAVSQIWGSPVINHTNNLYGCSNSTAFGGGGGNLFKLWVPRATFNGYIANGVGGTSPGTVCTITTMTGGAVQGSMILKDSGGVLAAGTQVAANYNMGQTSGSFQVTPSQLSGSSTSPITITAQYAYPDKWGTLNCDYNGYAQSIQFAIATAGGVAAIDPPTVGYTYNSLATWKTNMGIETHSTIVAGSPFATTPASGNISSFAIAAGHPFLTASDSGGPIGALDGTLGRNGVAVGCNFWYPA